MLIYSETSVGETTVLNMKVNGEGVNKHIEISKELEIINFRVLQENLRYGAKENIGHWFLGDKKHDKTDSNETKDHFTTFQKAMRGLIILGQCLGLIPVSGILQKDVSKLRFTVWSWKFLYTMTLIMVESIVSVLCMYRLTKHPSCIGAIGFVAFYSTSCIATIVFLQIARKWPDLMKELSDARLDNYINPKIVWKCHISCIVFIGLAILEHSLLLLSKVAKLLDCGENDDTFWAELASMTSPWFYELHFTFNIPTEIALQSLNLFTTVVWNYLDMFVVCISLYLTSILEQINKRIMVTVDKNYMPTSIWGVLREDYTRATRLVRQFDDTFSTIILICFANDLFFVCQQLFNTLAPLRGYEYPIYVTFSLIFLISRFLILALATARINSASLEAASLLYRVPSSAYTKDVERFLNQVSSGGFVGFTGLRFFYITRELILSVAGTIVTYELVLLQFTTQE